MNKGHSIETINFRSNCPIAKTLDFLGDKWSLLILRDIIFFGAKTYSDFAKSPERIPTNLLSQRLKKLVEGGLLEKKAYQNNPTRYEYLATDKCKTVKPVLLSMKKLGEAIF